MKYFFYDCETGGNNTKYSLLSFYGVVLDENFNKIDDIDLKIKHKTYVVSPEAMKYNGIDLISHEKTAENIDVCRKKLETFLAKNTSFRKEILINSGHNVFWDTKFVTKRLFKDFDKYLSRHCLDTGCMALILKHMGKIPVDFEISLSNLVKYYNVNTGTLHEAKNDVWATILVLKCMLKDIEPKIVLQI